MQFCPKCGAAWRENAQFCTNCGYRLSADAGNPNAGYLTHAPRAVKMQPKGVKQLSAGSRAVRTLVSVLLCLILFSTLMSGMALACVRIAVSRTVITAAVYALDIEKAYLEDPDVSLIDELFDEVVNAEAAAEYGITKDGFVRFYNKSTTRAFLGDTASEFVSYILTGKGDCELTAEDIEDFVYDNKDVIEEELGYPLDESDRLLIRRGAIEALGGDKLSLSEALEGEVGEDALELVRHILSLRVMLVQFAVALVCAAGIFFLWFRYFVPFSRFVGVPLVIAGALYLLVAAGILLLPVLIGTMLGVVSGGGMIAALLCPPGIAIGIFGLLVLLAGAILLAVGTRKRRAARVQ